MNVIGLLIYLCLCCLGVLANDDPESFITITLINNSSHQFNFKDLFVRHPANSLQINNHSLLPRETALIVGSTNQLADLSGRIYFNNNAQFVIVVPRYFHVRQPVWFMSAPHVRSREISRRLNPRREGRSLAFIEATVVIEDADI